MDLLFSFKKIFLLEYSCFTMLCQFLLYSKVNQLYVYVYPLFFGFPSHLGHHRALSRVPCAIQQVLISYLFYTQYQQCRYVNPSLPIHPTTPLPPWYPYVCSLHLYLYFCFVNKIIYTNFFRFHIYALIYDICFSLSDLLHSSSFYLLIFLLLFCDTEQVCSGTNLFFFNTLFKKLIN